MASAKQKAAQKKAGAKMKQAAAIHKKHPGKSMATCIKEAWKK